MCASADSSTICSMALFAIPELASIIGSASFCRNKDANLRNFGYGESSNLPADDHRGGTQVSSLPSPRPRAPVAHPFCAIGRVARGWDRLLNWVAHAFGLERSDVWTFRRTGGPDDKSQDEFGVPHHAGFACGAFDFAFLFPVAPAATDLSSTSPTRVSFRVTPAQIVCLSANLEAVFVRPQGAHSFP